MRCCHRVDSRRFCKQLERLEKSERSNLRHETFESEKLNLRQKLETFESEILEVDEKLERFLKMESPPKVNVRESTVNGAGLGLFADETFEKNEIVTLYPGTVYSPGDTGVFLTSFRNNYILRRNDGYTVDGKPFGLSGMIYRDIVGRDALNANVSWIEDHGKSFGLGHRVNTTKEEEFTNLVYVEIKIPRDLLEKNHRTMYPKLVNAVYSNENLTTSPYFTRSIALVTLQPVLIGDEFFVSYDFIATPTVRDGL